MVLQRARKLLIALVATISLGLTAQALADGPPHASPVSASAAPLIDLDALGAPPQSTSLRVVRRVVIDPGHGGTNVGALGVGHVHEKHLTLPIAMHLADRLRAAHPELEIVLTRHADIELGLAERAAIANRVGADLFISVHLNSALNPEAVGVETFWVDDCAPPLPAAAERGRLVALVESLPRIAGVARQRCENADRARRFAEALHVEYAARLPGVFDRGVKRGDFTVLRRSDVPAIVAELGFLSHAHEGMAVLEPDYQARLVESLVAAVERYDGALAEDLSHAVVTAEP